MANWRDILKDNTRLMPAGTEKTLREQNQIQEQMQAQYASINRGNISTASKQETKQKLLTAINSNGPGKYEALGIVRILINFKSNEKKGGDADKAALALADLQRNVKVNQNLTAQELMELVKNRSSLFQRQLPETFKQLLKEIVPANLNALVTADNGPFLRDNGVINDQQFRTVLNRQNSDDDIPLDKIRTLFDLIAKSRPYSHAVAQTIAGALQQSIKDGFRTGLFVNHKDSQKYLSKFIQIYFSTSDTRFANQMDFRPGKYNSKTNLMGFQVVSSNPGTINSNEGIISELKSKLQSHYVQDDKNRLLSFIAAIENKDNTKPFNSSDYGGTWAYQQPVVGTTQQRSKIRMDNNRRAYAASRKSADFSNGPEFYGNQGNLVPSSFDSFLIQSGNSLGNDECAFVVFTQNQCITNLLSKSWSGQGDYFGSNTKFNKDWGVLTLLSEIAPDLYQAMTGELGVGATNANGADWTLRTDPDVSTCSVIGFDLIRTSDRIVRYKCSTRWFWKESKVFYETIEAEVRITWNFSTNYVHYEILNTTHQLTEHPIFQQTDNPNLPRFTPLRSVF